MGFIVKINPLSYGVEGLRYALNGVSFYSSLTSAPVLISVTVVLLGIGMYQFSKIEL